VSRGRRARCGVTSAPICITSCLTADPILQDHQCGCQTGAFCLAMHAGGVVSSVVPRYTSDLGHGLRTSQVIAGVSRSRPTPQLQIQLGSPRTAPVMATAFDE
jgi:hypothetical protein